MYTGTVSCTMRYKCITGVYLMSDEYYTVFEIMFGKYNNNFTINQRDAKFRKLYSDNRSRRVIILVRMISKSGKCVEVRSLKSANQTCEEK